MRIHIVALILRIIFIGFLLASGFGGRTAAHPRPSNYKEQEFWPLVDLGFLTFESPEGPPRLTAPSFREDYWEGVSVQGHLVIGCAGDHGLGLSIGHVYLD